MAISDYVQQGAGSFTPTAVCNGAVAILASSIPFIQFDGVESDRVVGSAIKVGNEIMAITSSSGSTLGVKRGCEDTIPEAHADGERIWFIDAGVGGDGVVYTYGETVSVKVLPKTSSSGTIPMAAAPTNNLTFNYRFNRPYPPGYMRVGAARWYTVQTLDGPNPLALTWVHRDRVVQADQLVGHDEASVGPEVGVTYTATVYDETDSPVATYSGITGTAWSYTYAMAIIDFGLDGSGPPDLRPCHIIFRSTRAGLDSLRSYRIDFNLDPTDIAGWGGAFGYLFGGTP